VGGFPKQLFLQLFFIGLLGIFASPNVARAQSDMIVADDLADMHLMHQEMQNQGSHQLDLANPLHFRVLMAAMKRTGESAERSPELFRRLVLANEDGVAKLKGAAPNALTPTTQADAVPSPQDLNFIATFTEDDATVAENAGSAFQSTGLSSVVDGTMSSNIIIELYDEATGTVFGTENKTEHGQGTDFQVQVTGTVPAADTDTTTKTQAIFTYIPADPTLMSDGTGMPISVIHTYTDTVNATTGCMKEPNYCVRNGQGQCQAGEYNQTCTNQVANTTPIKLCWYRGSQAECDYWNSNNHPTDFVFPMSGNAVFPNDIVSPVTGNISIALQNPISGGGCNVYFEATQPMDSQFWTIDGNAKQINWDYPATAFPNTQECINYYNETMTNLWMAGYIALQGSNGEEPPFGALNFTSDRSQGGVPGVFIIPAMDIFQGCFAVDTPITLDGDGQSMMVQDFTGNQDEWVLSGDGQEYLVSATTSGREPFHKMVRLQTADGHNLLLTSTHPVFNDEGVPIMAKYFKVGDVVSTLEGSSTLTSVTREAYDGLVHNLRVSAREAAAHRSHGTVGGSLYAGGILAGDGQLQNQLIASEAEAMRRSPGTARARISPEWYQDFDNHN
jgi:hypothetical protein